MAEEPVARAWEQTPALSPRHVSVSLWVGFLLCPLQKYTVLQCVWFQYNESHSTAGIADTAKNVVNLLMSDGENTIWKGVTVLLWASCLVTFLQQTYMT